uniref:Uncharacterized protein n=1 Tax=Tetraselmis chuii TaxID=63592 RepID=A0A7S1SUA3_9CHLO|mmetsp:Transcript_2935/g.5253  ORF Transcript_2935/g.5253 Transcript_2935/m.5253 type:complete len:224 (+) Transcript_2935:359-1030(+)
MAVFAMSYSVRTAASAGYAACAEPTRGGVQASLLRRDNKTSAGNFPTSRRRTSRQRSLIGRPLAVAVAQPACGSRSDRSEGNSGGTGAGLMRGWSERYSSTRQQILDLGTAGACTLVVCNATYFLCAFLFVWLNVLQVQKGMTLAMAGLNVAEAFGITYASCQVTKLPRIVGTLLLVPAVQCALQRLTGGDRRQYRRVFFSLLVAAITTVLGSIGLLVLAWMS